MNINPFESAMKQLAKAARYLDDPQKIALLKQPQRIINVATPVRMDDGEIRIFQGYRVQYNNNLGPYKGGIRFHPQVSLDEVMALSFWMMMKCAVANIPMGGGKGGVMVDPKTLSVSELERLSRGYVRAIADCIGPDKDVPAPDVNTNGVIMGWMTDEYVRMTNNKYQMTNEEKKKLRAAFTGKLIKDGGSEGREEATGKGGLYVLQAILSKMKPKTQNPKSKINSTLSRQLTVAVQGFGNVGYNIAKFLRDEGFRVMAISDSKGGVYVPEGLDPTLTLECKRKTGTLAGCYCKGSVCDSKGGRRISNEELLELPVDILVPAAMENVITGANASRIQAKIVLEMANGPTASEADATLANRNIVVIPDILSNSGGVTVSTLEWEQNLKGQHWTKEEVNTKLKKKMEDAVDSIWEVSKNYKTDLRTAAFVVALERIFR